MFITLHDIIGNIYGMTSMEQNENVLITSTLLLYRHSCQINKHTDLYFDLQQVSKWFQKQSLRQTLSVLSDRAYACE